MEGDGEVKLIARHLTVDLYNCKNSKLKDYALIKHTVGEGLDSLGFDVLELNAVQVDDSHYVLLAIMQEGHLTLHVYTDLKYVAFDVFLCEENAQPEDLSKLLRSFFQADKTKTTLLKRGDFTSTKDVRPKVKTKVAPLRKIHNTGAKVIRILARRKQ